MDVGLTKERLILLNVEYHMSIAIELLPAVPPIQSSMEIGHGDPISTIHVQYSLRPACTMFPN